MAAAAVPEKRVVSWVFDVVVIAVGLVLAVSTFGWLLVSGQFTSFWAIALLVGAPAIAMVSRFPLTLTRSMSGVEVGFESAILIFLTCFHSGVGALAVWAVGQLISQFTTAKRMDIRLFNLSLAVISGTLAYLTITWLGLSADPTIGQLAAVTVACVIFFATDYLLSAVSVALEGGTRVRDEMQPNNALAALGVFVGVNTLGYLGALLVREVAWWTVLLLVIPMSTILVATRALSRGLEHRRRLEALFDAAAEAQVVNTRAELEELLVRNACAAVGHPKAALRLQGPGAGEVGAQVRTASGPIWLVAPAYKRARASIEADRKALETLATVGEETFSRLELTEELAHLARHDALTSLPNRVLFYDRVEHAVHRARRTGSRLAVLFLDLDGFKGVNDRFGHAEGDALLNAVSERLQACVRAADTVARLGGDEFAVLVEDVHDTTLLDELCERLLIALRTEIPIMGHEVVVGTSIGVAVADHADDADEVLRNADMAMYRAKALGKDRYFVYEPSLREENVRRLELVEALRRGVSDELVVHYQPVVDLGTGQVEGLEALVRWRRDGQLVPPDAFIRAAEESGLIVELGERVLRQVVEDSEQLSRAAGKPVSLGVNMSAHQLRAPGFLRMVAEAVDGLGRNPLILEMTETVVITDDADTDSALRHLKDLGVRLALDDFGVGFSSVGYLQHLPVDIIKIDRSFIRDVDESPRAKALVDAILVMGSALELTVVAEGVERPGQLTRLRHAGCRLGQGYLFAPPRPLDEALVLLAGRELVVPTRSPRSGVLI